MRHGIAKKSLLPKRLEKRLLLDASIPVTAGLSLHLDAADASTILDSDGTNIDGVGGDSSFDGSIARWVDKSGQDNDVVQVDMADRPGLSTINGLTALDYDGNGDFLEDDDAETYLNGLNGITIFKVFQSNLQGVDNGLFTTDTPSGRDDRLALRYDAVGFSSGASEVLKAGMSTTSGDTSIETSDSSTSLSPQMVSMSWQSGGAISIHIDGTADTPSAPSGSQAGLLSDITTLLVGKGTKDETATSSWDGQIAEMIIYNRTLTATETDDVENYLASKWGVQIGGNTLPTIDANNGVNVDEGGIVTINNTDLAASDAEGGIAPGWYDPDWQYRQEITIDHTNVDADLTDFVLLIDGSNLGSDFWGNVQSDGGDIVLTDAAGNKLDRELVSIDTVAEAMELHVRVPSLSSTVDTDLFIYYGNVAANEMNDAAGTFSNYEHVYHMNVLDAVDVVSANNGTNNGDGTITTGIIGNAHEYDDDGFVDIATIDGTNIRTVSLWYSPQDRGGGNFGTILGSNSYNSGIRHVDTNEIGVRSGGGGLVVGSSGSFNVDTHLMFSYDSVAGTISLFENGLLQDSNSFSGWHDFEYLISIAGDDRRAPDGIVDEVRLSEETRSIEWAAAEYRNQSNPSTFYSAGMQETASGPVSYWLESEVTNGTLFLDLNGNSMIETGETLMLGGTFTQDDINNNLLKYIHNGSETSSDSFGFAISDGTDNVTGQRFDIIVNPVNDVPTVINGAVTVDEGASLSFDLQTLITDAEGVATSDITVNNDAVNGALSYDSANGIVTYTHNDSETIIDSFTFTVDDGTGPITRTINITINPVIDDDDINAIPDQVFHFDAQDIDADGDTTDNPADESAINIWEDGSGNNLDATQAAGSRQPTYDADAFNGRGGLRFDGGSDNLDISNSNLINTGTYDEKSFAIVFETSGDVSGLQMLYEQGGGSNGYNIAIVDGDLYAYVWGENYFSGDTTIKINLGPVQPNSSNYVVISQDSTDPVLTNRTWSASLNGGTLQTVNGVDVQGSHTGNVTIGHSNDSQHPVTDNNLGPGSFFEGSIGEFFSWNHALTAQEVADLSIYLERKWINQPPTLNTNLTLDVIQNAQSTITSAELEASDVDNAPDELTYGIISLATNGTIFLSSTALGIGDTFTQEDINNSLVNYQHAGSPGGADSFDFIVSDGLETLAVATFDLNITAAPVGDPFVTAKLPMTIDEGATYLITTTELDATDSDTADTDLVYEITASASTGTLFRDGVALGLNDTFTQQDVADGLITYTHDDSENFLDSYEFTVTDGTFTTDVETFAITVNPVNDQAPTDIDLTNTSVNETSSVGTLIGILNGTDADLPGDALTFSIIDDPDNRFQLNGDRLEVGNTLNHENQDSHNVTIRVSDGVQAYDETFVINVNDVNENPGSLSLSNNNVNENSGLGTVVGTLSATDPDLPGDTFTYTIISDPDNKFSVVGDQLRVDGALDFEADNSHDVIIRVNDGNGGARNQGFTININEINDIPIALGGSGALGHGNTLVLDTSILSATDVDDTDADLIFEMVMLPADGEVQLHGTDLRLNDTFTQQDIIDGHVSYVQNSASTATSDGFSFTVTDGSLTTDVQSVDFIISPALGAVSGFNLDEGGVFTLQSTNLEYQATWFHDDWSYRQAITIDAARVDGDLSDFALLLTENGFGADFWDNVNSDGSDIVITSSDGVTKLDRELVSIDTSAETMQLYARTDLLASANTTLYVYYGNASASEPNQATTWRSEFTGVWHFDDDFTDGAADDSSQQGNHAFMRGGFDQTNQVGGQTGTAADFDGSNDYLALDYAYSGNNTLPEVSVSAWINTNFSSGGFNNNWALIDFDRSEFFNVYISGSGEVSFSTSGSGLGIDDFDSTGVSVNDGNWHHIAAVYDNTDKILYVNGTEVARDTNSHGGSALGQGTRYGFIGDGSEAGSFDANRNNIYYQGQYDNIRLFEGVIEGAWVAAEFRNHHDPSSFYSVSGQIAQGDHFSYTLTDEVDNGTLFVDTNANSVLDGGEILGLGATFRQSDINSGRLLYLHQGANTSNDSFSFIVSDDQGRSSIANTLSININPLNVPPTSITPVAINIDDAFLGGEVLRNFSSSFTSSLFERSASQIIHDNVVMTSQDYLSLYVIEEEQSSRLFAREFFLPQRDENSALPENLRSAESPDFTNLRKSLDFLSQMDDMKSGSESEFLYGGEDSSSHIERKFIDVRDYQLNKMERLRMALMS